MSQKKKKKKRVSATPIQKIIRMNRDFKDCQSKEQILSIGLEHDKQIIPIHDLPCLDIQRIYFRMHPVSWWNGDFDEI